MLIHKQSLLNHFLKRLVRVLDSLMGIVRAWSWTRTTQDHKLELTAIEYLVGDHLPDGFICLL